jgi:type I restriction-modification system DNA methylase subunit
LSLVRKDIRQFLEEHDDIQSILALGSFLFSVTIIALFLDLANAYTSLSKDVIFFVLAVLLIEVIFNERYDNALKLIERTLTSSRPGRARIPS